MDVDLAFEANLTIEEFMAMVKNTTRTEEEPCKENNKRKEKRKKKKERRKKKEEKRKKKFNPFSTPMSVISVEEGEYKNGDVLYIVEKNEEEDR